MKKMERKRKREEKKKSHHRWEIVTMKPNENRQMDT